MLVTQWSWRRLRSHSEIWSCRGINSTQTKITIDRHLDRLKDLEIFAVFQIIFVTYHCSSSVCISKAKRKETGISLFQVSSRQYDCFEPSVNSIAIDIDSVLGHLVSPSAMVLPSTGQCSCDVLSRVQLLWKLAIDEIH